MNNQLHIMITRDRGKIVRFPCTTKKLGIILSVSIFTLIFLVTTSILSISLFTENRATSSKILELRQELEINKATIVEHERTNETQKLKLNLQVANLEFNNAKQAAAFKK